MPELTTLLPSEELIFLVNGHRDQSAFSVSRLATVENIISLLKESGIDHISFNAILDFGCGCGRVLAGWQPYLRPSLTLHGVDINPSLIAFCKANIPFATAEVSQYMPPLGQFFDSQFDFVYAASVFTHLNLESTRAWAAEFYRIIRPGGILMMSFHGAWYLPELKRIAENGPETLSKKGFFLFLHGKQEDTFDGSNNYASFMTPKFVDDLFSNFRLVQTFPGTVRGPNPFASYQDISIYRRNSG